MNLDIFMICIHDLFIVPSLHIHDLFMTYSWNNHDTFIVYLLYIHDIFKTYSRQNHDIFMKYSWICHAISWYINDIFVTYRWHLNIIDGVWFCHKILRISPEAFVGPIGPKVPAKGWHSSMCRPYITYSLHIHDIFIIHSWNFLDIWFIY